VALTPRQRLCYQDLVNIWRPVYAEDSSTKEEAATSFAPVATNVPCHYLNKMSPETAGPFGRFEEVSFFTRDEFHFDVAQEMGAEYLLQLISVDRNGNQVPKYGQYWLVAGTPQQFPARGGRNANYLLALAVQQPNPPRNIL
jgi:hypothetical protein